MLLALAILAFLAHIVPLPFSVHAPFTTSTESHGPSHGGAGASHVASCDATTSRTAPTVDGPGWTLVVAAQPMSLVQSAPPLAVKAVAVRSSRDHTGPPLFVLHATFLI